MAYGSSITPWDLECMLYDETAEPKALPLSLLEEITKGFSDEQQIGSGAFAVVYKGKLENRTVAVKRMYNTYMYEKEFQREVECLMMAKHKNVVRFLGYCADTQGNMARHEGKFIMADVQQRLLCFEYLPKGSLHEYITDTSRGLRWKDRYQIITGICQGLYYLHQKHIVHLDLKPSNILLDDNWVPKITDFGISRCFHEMQSQVITKMAGTPGYLAPESYNHTEITYRHSHRLDIYSLGVVIIEILTGKKGYHDVDMVVESWSNMLEKSESEVQLKQVRVCAQIGIECTNFDPAKRPDVHCIISRLDEIEPCVGFEGRSNESVGVSREFLLSVPMAAVVMTTIVWPLVSMLKDKASSYLLDRYKVMEGMEEEHKTLKRKIAAILDVITDAEEQATTHREGVKPWLQELKTVAYEANEVFEEFKYEALRREANKNGHYRMLGFDVIKLLPTHNRVVFRHTMGHKLRKILQAIEALIAEMHAFGFKCQPQPSLSEECRQTDYVIIDPQEIAKEIASRSRHKEKKEIVDILLGQASKADLAVVPIVGMGGLGKTTLAQLIYNEPEVQKHFQLLLWVCVSDTFDVNSLAKSIVEASPKKNDDPDKPPLDRLQKLISGQRYLLVLDDVWITEVPKWERLKVCLQHGGTSSAVLTTTCDERVAEIMGTGRTCHLNKLEDRFLKEIIAAKAFSSEKEKPAELVEMVGEIAKRCSGSPLAATLLGSVLRTKTTVKEWKAVSSRSIVTDETGILPILKLSYNNLPSHMKQCFAFCAVFPRDYKIDVEKLIQLWIANGFIPENKEDSLETTGKHIFNELASRSFFQDIEESKDLRNHYRTTCKIHYIMHEIAMFVMRKECVVATEKPSQTEWLPDTARHFFFHAEKQKVYRMILWRKNRLLSKHCCAIVMCKAHCSIYQNTTRCMHCNSV